MFKKLRSKINVMVEKKATQITINNIQNSINMNTANTSWKTTLAGLLTGLTPIIYALIDAYNSGAFTGKNGEQVAIGMGLIAIGVLSKDKDKTGATK